MRCRTTRSRPGSTAVRRRRHDPVRGRQGAPTIAPAPDQRGGVPPPASYGAAGNRLFVTCGIGFSLVPMRINARPQVVFFELVPAP